MELSGIGIDKMELSGIGTDKNGIDLMSVSPSDNII